MRALDFIVSRILPEDLRRESYDLSKKGLSQLMAQVATRYPEKFPEIAKQLGDLGRNASWTQAYTIGRRDTAPVVDTKAYYAKMDAEIDHLRKRKLPPEEFDKAREEVYTRYSDLIEKETMRAALAGDNSIAKAVASGARGNASHVKAILSTPALFQDAKDRTIPLFVRHSYAQGVRPGETLASTYGARKSTVATKSATAKGGDLLKIMTQSALNFNVTEKDCGAANGILLEPGAGSLSGRVLARDAAGIPAGTIIDRHVEAKLRGAGKPVVARSAMTCRAEHGLCSRCLGLQADGKFPTIGDSVGVTAAQAIGEPIVQASLDVKHNAGMAKGKKSFSGLKYVTQFLQIPEEFQDRAAVAEVDGVVEKVEPAPQGGTFIHVGGQRHFVLPGFEPTVKPGQKVEAGEIMSEGLASPADIVRLRGMGEGRRYYADRLAQMLTDSGSEPDPRNVEILARAAVDNYVLDDPDEDSPWLPDDAVRESELLRNYRTPKDAQDTPLDRAVGRYLQTPLLHYSVGTRLTPKMTDTLRQAGYSSALVADKEPWFHPEMKRLRTAAHGSGDWLASMGTSYLSSQLRDSVERGDDTNIKTNYHYGPRLAFGGDLGEGAFGANVERTGRF
jgi:DNA-directed RNA polymerase subunit beta'